LDPKLSSIANEGKKKGDKRDKKKNKKNTYNQWEQRKDEAWKKEPLKDGEKHKKEVGKYTYHWCEHHMAWTVRNPPTASWASSTRKIRRSSLKRPTQLPLLLLLRQQ
jgi:hypothetical protein